MQSEEVVKMRNKVLMYKVYNHESMGYCIMVYNKEAMFWQQVTPWYLRLGNLKKFHPEYF